MYCRLQLKGAFAKQAAWGESYWLTDSRAVVNLPDKRTVMGRESGIARSRLNCENLTGLAPGWVVLIRPQHYVAASVFFM